MIQNESEIESKEGSERVREWESERERERKGDMLKRFKCDSWLHPKCWLRSNDDALDLRTCLKPIVVESADWCCVC